MFLSHSHKIMTNLQLQHSGRIFQRLGTSSVSKVLAVQMQGCKQTKLSVTIHDHNPSTGETETGRSLANLQDEFQLRERPCLKNTERVPEE